MVPLPAKLLKVPLLTITSVLTKFTVDALVVNVTAIEESLVVVPEVTVVLAIVIVGEVLSYIQLN